MKILYLWHYKDYNNYDHYLNVDFAAFMKTYPGIELYGYGLKFEEGYRNLTILPYQKKITLADIYKIFPFDIIIVNTKGRCFEYYNPHINQFSDTWLPSDFKSWSKTPKIIFEEDMHYEENDDWYAEMKFDLVLQRHYSQSLRNHNTPVKFFPFSVDISTFNPWKDQVIHRSKIIPLTNQSKREKIIAFIGNDGDKAYIYRFRAIRKLVEAKLGINFSNAEPNSKRLVDGEYIEILRKYIAYVSCGSIYEICAAKNFEIMASGGLLFTNNFLGIDKLFPSNSYITYKNDWTDIIEQGKKIINEPEYVKEIVKNGRICINEKHTHEKRIEELLEIIRKLK